MVALAPANAHVPTPTPVLSEITRFTIVDLDTHGNWIIKRLLKAYPQQSERSIFSWLRNILHDNSSLFLAQKHACCLFQVVNVFTLEHKPMVIERFVLCQEGHVQEGIDLYAEAAKWAKSMGIEQLLVEQLTDIPRDLIQEKLGRLFMRQQVFARL